ncbi:hypothetical protein [Clostridium gasigenes]|uniref:Polymer-forming protein n=1 Tax=Clostridium gasigenes TaxID=94869 RepID=A0A1H0TYV9_9CLOT|nr:hypothetical protein [Clostridium gasigenes]MBB6624337.1 hypothetical protein [Clostridium gasigenes]SDP59081.1 hypothetical protein SAMN04488529_108140 [Clostridium gasigenes]
MKSKSLVIGLLLVTALFVGCGSKKVVEETKAPETTKEESVDAVTSSSIVKSDDGLIKALSADGTWIIAITGDLQTTKELVMDGVFYSKDDKANGLARKLALYDQDADKKVTASHTLTAPKMTVKSENGKIQEGTFVGDIYVEANGFLLKNTKVKGNVYFANEEYKNSFKLDGGEISGVTEVKK